MIETQNKGSFSVPKLKILSQICFELIRVPSSVAYKLEIRFTDSPLWKFRPKIFLSFVAKLGNKIVSHNIQLQHENILVKLVFGVADPFLWRTWIDTRFDK